MKGNHLVQVKFFKANLLLFEDLLFFPPNSQVANKVTGEHSCMMIKLMDASEGESPLARNKWVKNASQEFLRRFISLLGGPFSNLPSLLALKVIQSHSTTQEKGMGEKGQEVYSFMRWAIDARGKEARTEMMRLIALDSLDINCFLDQFYKGNGVKATYLLRRD